MHKLMHINDFLFLLSISKQDQEISPCSCSGLSLPGRGHVLVRCSHTVTGLRTLFLFLPFLDLLWNSLVPSTPYPHQGTPVSDHQPNRGLSRLPVRVPIPVHMHATPDVKTTDIHARVCRCTHKCIRTYTWACACTCTYVHSTCKPEKSSYPISKAKGKMAAMISLQQHIMRTYMHLHLYLNKFG